MSSPRKASPPKRNTPYSRFSGYGSGYCHRQHYLQIMEFEDLEKRFHHHIQIYDMNVRRSSGLDSFMLQGLIPAFCDLEYSCIIACHLPSNCTQLRNSHTQILVFHR